MIRVLLADDHPALRMGLRVLLDRAPDIEVVGEADDGNAALALLESLRPDVAVLDCQLPGLDGAAVAQEATRRGLPAHIVALSAYDDDRYLTGMLAAGAVGYLLKNEAPGQIVAAVQAAMRGERLWTPEQAARVSRWQAEVARVRDSLTEREREVLRLVADGLSNKEIAQALTITVRTTDFHVSNILRKLGVISRVEAAVWAQAHLI
ncbi:MAG TPA: response regulator transcription factor [Anaerolineae bacterium]|nr:response regulator transcription factor [Anaerolineae bacterium]HQI86871.1 response regulator transcription factor [Anaerolineae bacterium]